MSRAIRRRHWSRLSSTTSTLSSKASRSLGVSSRTRRRQLKSSRRLSRSSTEGIACASNLSPSFRKPSSRPSTGRISSGYRALSTTCWTISATSSANGRSTRRAMGIHLRRFSRRSGAASSLSAPRSAPSPYVPASRRPICSPRNATPTGLAADSKRKSPHYSLKRSPQRC